MGVQQGVPAWLGLARSSFISINRTAFPVKLHCIRRPYGLSGKLCISASRQPPGIQYQTDISQSQSDISQSQSDISQFETDISQFETDISQFETDISPYANHALYTYGMIHREGWVCADASP